MALSFGWLVCVLLLFIFGCVCGSLMLVCKSQFLMLATSWLFSCRSMVVSVFVAFFGVACFFGAVHNVLVVVF